MSETNSFFIFSKIAALQILHMCHKQNKKEWWKLICSQVHTCDPDVVEFRGFLCDFGAEGA